MANEQQKGRTGQSKARRLTMTAMLAAIAFVLMMLEISLPFLPEFLKLDVSELPALIGAFSLGPISGVLICILKNILHLTITHTGGVGELSNALLGICFVAPAGIFYQKMKSRKGAFFGSLAGAVFMAGSSVVINYYIVYPAYTMFMSMEGIVRAYQLIFPKIDNLFEALVLVNAPFNLGKGLLNTAFAFLVYKRLSPVIKGSC